MQHIDHGAEPLTLGTILADAWAHRVIVLASVLLFGLAATAVAFTMTPVYRASILLLPSPLSGQTGSLTSMLNSLGGLGALAGLSSTLGIDNTTTEAIALVQSRGFVEDFIRQNHLLPKLFEGKWDPQRNDWKADVRHPPTLYRGYKRFTGEILTAAEDKKTKLVTLQIDWRDRVEGAAWANQLVEIVNERLRQRAIDESTETIRFLEQEAQTAQSVEVKVAINAMIEQQLKTRALATVRKQYAFQILDPAEPADRDVMVRPRRLLYIASGAVLGLAIGVYAAVVRSQRRRRNPVPS